MGRCDEGGESGEAGGERRAHQCSARASAWTSFAPSLRAHLLLVSLCRLGIFELVLCLSWPAVHACKLCCCCESVLVKLHCVI